MSQSIAEFIYFKVKPSVKPEDPNNQEGEDLLNVFRAGKHQSGHSSSAWGRTVEDPDTIVWVIGKLLYTTIYTTKLTNPRMDRPTQLNNSRTPPALPSYNPTATNSALHNAAAGHIRHGDLDQEPGDGAMRSAIPEQSKRAGDQGAECRSDQFPYGAG